MRTEKKGIGKALLIVVLALTAYHGSGFLNELYALLLSSFLGERISGEMLVIIYKIGGYIITALVSVPVFYGILQLDRRWKPYHFNTKKNLEFSKWMQYFGTAMILPAILILTESIFIQTGQMDVKNLISMAIPDLLLEFFQYVCFMPIVEELMFRGFLLKMLLPYGINLAVAISAVSWSIGHGNPVNIIMTLPIGFVLGYLACKTEGLKYTILIHMVINLLGNFMIPILLHFSIGQKVIPVVAVAAILIGVIVFIKKRKELFSFTRS